MNWNKPYYENCRFGFEVTMYIMLKPNQTQQSAGRKTSTVNSLGLLGLGLSALISSQTLADTATTTTATTTTSTAYVNTQGGNSQGGNCDDQGINGVSWPLHGLNRFNSANSSTISKVNKSNASTLQLKWIYNINPIPFGTAQPLPNPITNPRAENSATQGVAVDTSGIVYVPTFDGRMLKIDSLHTSNTLNADGSKAPVLLSQFDFFGDPQYAGGGFDGFTSRLHPSLINGAIYAGNYKFFLATTQQGTAANPVYADRNTGTTSPTNPNYSSKGSVLYKIDPKTGKLLWKTVVDSNQQTMISAVGASVVPSVWGNLIIVGFTSEISGTVAIYPIGIGLDPFAGTCCNERGGVAAVRESDGRLLWKNYTSPTPVNQTLNTVINHGTVNGWFGAGVWGGGNFPVSYNNRLVYAGTGEIYTSPDAADTCESQRLLTCNPSDPNYRACLVDSNATCLHYLQDGTYSPGTSFADTKFEQLIPLVRSPKLPQSDAIVAYNYNTGDIKWAQPIGGFDVWNAGCFDGFVEGGTSFFNGNPFCPLYIRCPTPLDANGNCTTNPNWSLQFAIKDRDVTQPILIEGVTINGTKRDIVLGMSKGAVVQAFDAADGTFLWSSNAFGPGGLNGDGFVWGKAADGKRFYGSTGSSSGITLTDYQNCDDPLKVAQGLCTQHIVPGSCTVNLGTPPAGFALDTDPTSPTYNKVRWIGGVYVAVNLVDGSTVWQRCITGRKIDPVTRQLLVPEGTFAARSQAALSYANGVVVAPGASAYVPWDVRAQEVFAFAEVLLLDADTGKLIKSLPLSLPGQPSANGVTYQRPIIVGDRLYITNGFRRANGVNNAPEDAFNRVMMYQLP